MIQTATNAGDDHRKEQARARNSTESKISGDIGDIPPVAGGWWRNGRFGLTSSTITGSTVLSAVRLARLSKVQSYSARMRSRVNANT